MNEKKIGQSDFNSQGLQLLLISILYRVQLKVSEDDAEEI